VITIHPWLLLLVQVNPVLISILQLLGLLLGMLSIFHRLFGIPIALYVVIKFWSMLESDMFPVKESYHLYSSLLSSVFNSLKPKWWFLYLGGFPTDRNELKGHMFSILFSWQECGWGCWWTWSCLCWRVAILSGRGSN